MSQTSTPDIIYTIVDEAPQLAAASLLPIVTAFAAKAGATVGTRDISLAGRIIAAFPERLTDAQRQSDDLAALGDLVKTPHANVIKLPNISASVPQLKAAIAELQGQGYDLPDYPEDPATDEEREAQRRYDAIKGSAVNPVLREGNSDRRAAKAVKNYAMANPHSMGTWSGDSKTHVSSMDGHDFFSNETSATISAAQAGAAKIVHVADDGTETVLKDGLKLAEGTVVDATFLSVRALRAFLDAELADAKAKGVLFSLHMKATMMKVSDPIIFGHAVRAYLGDAWDKHGDAIGVSPNGGLGEIEKRAGELGGAVEADLNAARAAQPPLYMVNSDRGITNLHVPSDVIIDASMPAVIRAGGKAWGPDGKEHDVKCVIPDNSYAPVYDASIAFFKANGALDPTTAGAVSNVGLMAQKAEEYGSHPTTFEAAADGVIRYVLASGEVLHEHRVEKGDIWRSSTVNRAPIEDWIKLGRDRQKATGAAAVFWLDENRAHDREILKYVRASGTDIPAMAPREATTFTLETITKGEDCISITGNVLRDYLTDLFPILELGTSAKMLSIVKLMQGGGLFETGAGGSAPKHVQQFEEEGHLRWDSLGEFSALAESFNFLAETSGNTRAAILARGVEAATQGVLDHDRSPSRRVGQPDNRDSHYWFARYWAEYMAGQTDDAELAESFRPVAEALAEQEAAILADLAAAKGSAQDLGGYYHTDPAKTAAAMRPSATFNAIID